MVNDKEMAEYIYSILMADKIKIWSWGFHDPRIIHNGLTFSVNGFKHKGKVSIQYNEGQDLFDVFLLDDNDKTVDTINMVYFDQLIEVIDDKIEKTDDYNDRINKEYNIG